MNSPASIRLTCIATTPSTRSGWAMARLRDRPDDEDFAVDVVVRYRQEEGAPDLYTVGKEYGFHLTPNAGPGPLLDAILGCAGKDPGTGMRLASARLQGGGQEDRVGITINWPGPAGTNPGLDRLTQGERYRVAVTGPSP